MSAITISAMDASSQGAATADAATGPLSGTSMAKSQRMTIRPRITDCSQEFSAKVNRT